MSQDKLVKEIIKTCKYFRIIELEVDSVFIEKKIATELDDVIFVENLLSIFYKKKNQKCYQKKLNQQRFKNLLLELEKIRLNLEFKGE